LRFVFESAALTSAFEPNMASFRLDCVPFGAWPGSALRRQHFDRRPSAKCGVIGGLQLGSVSSGLAAAMFCWPWISEQRICELQKPAIAAFKSLQRIDSQRHIAPRAVASLLASA